MAFLSRFKDGLRKTRESLSDKLSTLTASFKKVDEEFFEELLELLVLSDVGVETAEELCKRVKLRAKKENISDTSEIKGVLRDEVKGILESVDSEMHLNTKPSVIIVVGVNGVGKTTTIGKMAKKYRDAGKNVILAAADTFRAAATEQLSVWAERAGVPIVSQGEGAEPAAVLYDTLESAKSRGSDIVICDTAGRLHNKKPLMDELFKIYKVIGKVLPEADVETLLVIDATTGQNAVIQASQFGEVLPLTGIILTKLDGTAKGGIVLPICEKLHIPVKFVGLGEKEDDLELFSAEDFADGLIGE